MAIQIRRGTDSGWESNNSNIVAGEPAVATDTERFFVGVDSGEYMELSNINLIAPQYDSSATYNVGDYVIYQGRLYVCNTANTTGAWNSSKWNSISLKQALDDLATRSVPTSVREAIYTLLNNAAYATTGLTDEIAVVQSWAGAVTSLTLSASSLSLSGSTPQTLIPTVVPSSASVSWSSSDNSIATVVGGIVTGVYNGSCVITATAGGLSANCAVTVSGFATLESISAVYTQSGTVYDTDSLDSLKADLVVTATYDDTSTATVPSGFYSLSGTLEVGTSTITVTYRGKTTTFTVTVTKYTRASIEYENKAHKWNSTAFEVVDRTNSGITIKYSIPPTNKLYPAGVIVYAGSVIANDTGAIMTYDDNGIIIGGVSEKISGNNRWSKVAGSTYSEFSNLWTLSSNYTKITFDLDMRYLDDSYMYDKTTGMVFFAGINTPYWGMSNISEANL